nr:MAG TPA: hypothetical protein [Caudoviricetes sp.]
MIITNRKLLLCTRIISVYNLIKTCKKKAYRLCYQHRREAYAKQSTHILV